MDKIQYGLLEMRDGDRGKQREDKDGRRENCEQKKECQCGRSVEDVVILKFAPQLLGKIDKPQVSWSVRGDSAPFPGSRRRLSTKLRVDFDAIAETGGSDSRIFFMCSGL